jgi:hypothetical protein
VMHLAREAELEVEPRNVTELLQSHGKTWMDEWWFLEMEFTGKDTVNIVTMTRDLDYYLWAIGVTQVVECRIVCNKLSWLSSSKVWEDWLQLWKRFYSRLNDIKEHQMLEQSFRETKS